MFRQDGSILEQLFFNNDIRVYGTVDEPLFMMAHLATQLKDSNYLRTLKTLTEHKHYIYCKNNTNDLKKTQGGRDPILLTESGVYVYLVRCELPAAEPFVDWVVSKLKEIRKKEIDDARLREKIAGDYSKLMLEKITRIREDISSAKLIIKHSPVTTYKRELHHSENDILYHAVGRWITQQLIHTDVLYNRCIIPAPLMHKLYDMAEVYLDDGRHDEFYDDLFPILCQFYGAEYDGKIIPPDQKMRFLPL